ncbi:MAG: SUMF1/EgtB/PvdO family nonheme iron enzyme [Planctomycetes bacterium]|nr:SUMF1/EgtB/PvdO family nonheme iron enzyme [Planctomycetota bacterium]
MSADDLDFDHLDDLLQRALDGGRVGSEYRALTPAQRREFDEMLELRGGRPEELDLGEEPIGARDEDPAARSVAAFLDAYWRDRAEDRDRSLADYLAEFPGAVEEVARCYLALVSGSRGAADAGAGQVATYRCEETLGRGGQATVHRAVDVKLGRKVALKVFHLGAALDDRGLERFKREARAVSRLSHPGIGKIFEAGVDNGQPFIAMELVSGSSLTQLIQEGRSGDRLDRQEIERRLEILEQVARALETAHAAGVVHRDLKPGNVMLREDGSPVLLDFGLAKILDDQGPSLTASLDVLGTPAYIAPERLRHPKLEAAPTEDVYALGITAYELLSGRRPFEAPTIEELFRRVLRGDATPLDRAQAGIGRDLAVVVATAMELEPQRRYRSAADLAEDLGRLRRGETVSVRPVGGATKALRWYRRNAVVATLGLLVLATLTAFSISTALGKRRIDRLRQEAVERGDSLASALDEVLVLSDVKKANDLVAEESSLWPVAPETLPRMRDWLNRAEELLRRRARHETGLAALLERKIPLDQAAIAAALPHEWAELERMRDQLKTYEDGRAGLQGGTAKAAQGVVSELLSPRIKAYEALVARLENSSYPEAADAWRAEVLRHLVAQIARIDPEDGTGLLAGVRARMAAAESLVADTIEGHVEAWRRAGEELAADRRFAGFELRPITGLVPLGRDPDSGLQEFLHFLSHEQKEVPKRDAEGRLPALDPDCGLIFVLVPGGAFTMGSVLEPGKPHYDPMARDYEGPRHQVVLDPFLASKYEAWQAAWIHLAGRNPSSIKIGDESRKGEFVTPRNPVEYLSWFEAVDVLGHFGLDLPTEAQWECLARAGTDTIWSFGDDVEGAKGRVNVTDLAHAGLTGEKQNGGLGDFDDGYALHAPVGSYLPNPWGLHDTYGNVYEWCLDRFGYYDRPVRPGDGLRLFSSNDTLRIFRGGAFAYTMNDARSAARIGTDAQSPDGNIGVRPVMNIPYLARGR